MGKRDNKNLRDCFINPNNKKDVLEFYNKIIEVGIDFKLSKERKSVVNYKDQKKIKI